MTSDPKKCEARLETMPGIGKSLAADLRALGFAKVGDLRGADPQMMYTDLCRKRGEAMDRCVLYAFRCAVYYADHENPRPERLKWWNWTDARLGRTPRR